MTTGKERKEWPLPFEKDGTGWTKLPLFIWVFLNFIYLLGTIPLILIGLSLFPVIASVCLCYLLGKSLLIGFTVKDGMAVQELKILWSLE
jgi:hypothetical protein